MAGKVDANPVAADGTAPSSVRLVDLNGDGLVDLVTSHAENLSVSINLGTGSFEPTHQVLPLVVLSDVLVSDLDGDGLVDLYLVSPNENIALRGDGSGLFVEATAALGLADGGHGLSAERIAADLFGAEEVLLHNVDGDVLFWATGNGFERASVTPAVAPTAAAGDEGLAALEQLVAGAAELLALDPGEELVLGLDDGGQPRVSVGTRHSQPAVLGGTAGAVAAVHPRNASLGASVVGATGPGSLGGGGNPPPGSPALTAEEQEILDAMSIVMLDDGAGNLVNKTIRFTGVNLQVVNGLGATNGNTNNPQTINPANTNVNGVGNLIVGYNELGNPLVDDRTGSHNVVLGQGNSHPSFGGLVAGRGNSISGVFAAVTGGEKNNAKARFGAISGGKSNTVKGAFTSVSGGTFNTAIGQNASVSGGQSNKAAGVASSVSGGRSNESSGVSASVSGGTANTAGGAYASVSGGQASVASGTSASVSGGYGNLATSSYTSISAGFSNTASAILGSVSGGSSNTASGNYSTVSGGTLNVASGNKSSISGGRNGTASGFISSVSGGSGNAASATYTSVTSGVNNMASATGATVSGGASNTASAALSSVSGGFGNVANAQSSSVSGGYQNTVAITGNNGSISGGTQNTVSGLSGSVSGGSFNLATGAYTSVSGGLTRTASSANNWVAGSLTENN